MAHLIGFRGGRSEPAGGVSFNMTPLIDCTFLLIIFFILASQMGSDSLAQLELPRPHASQAVSSDRRQTRRLIINVISAEPSEGVFGGYRLGQASAYKVEGRLVEIGDVETLAAIIAARRAEAGEDELQVEIRADRRVQFGHVQPAMDAALEAGVSRVNITALLEGG